MKYKNLLIFSKIQMPLWVYMIFAIMPLVGLLFGIKFAQQQELIIPENLILIQDLIFEQGYEQFKHLVSTIQKI